MELILEDTKVCLKQGISLMAQMEPGIYTQAHANCYDSTIGGHVRHNLDHFLCFEQGLATGSPDYNARDREEFWKPTRSMRHQKWKI
jgi:hypothetical protein